MISMLYKVFLLTITIYLHQTTDVLSQTADEYLYVCVAQTAYDSVVTDELDLVVGESYGILQTSPSGWWRAVNENGEEGWVPSNYFDQSDCTTPTAVPTRSPTAPTAEPTGTTLSPTGPTQSPTAPTSSPTEPTNEPSAHPTPEPSDSMVAQDVCEFDTGLCESPRCSNSTLDDDALCEVQYPDGSGCQTCQQGSFKKSDNHLCVPCSIDNCVECTSYHGCQTCESGFSAKWDPSCGLKTCFSDECTLETEKCESTNCADAAVDDNVNCLNQQDFGCTQCAPGYFQKSFQHLCVECSSVIDGCEVCQDWSGCSQCAPGKHIFWDDACGLHICL